MIRLLQRQGFIEHKPTSASEAAHQQRLLPVGYQFKLVSLQALHDGSLYCVLHNDAIGHVYPGPEVTGFSGLEEDQDGLFSTIRCRMSHMGTCSSESHTSAIVAYTDGQYVENKARRN